MSQPRADVPVVNVEIRERWWERILRWCGVTRIAALIPALLAVACEPMMVDPLPEDVTAAIAERADEALIAADGHDLYEVRVTLPRPGADDEGWLLEVWRSTENRSTAEWEWAQRYQTPAPDSSLLNPNPVQDTAKFESAPGCFFPCYTIWRGEGTWNVRVWNNATFRAVISSFSINPRDRTPPPTATPPVDTIPLPAVDTVEMLADSIRIVPDDTTTLLTDYETREVTLRDGQMVWVGLRDVPAGARVTLSTSTWMVSSSAPKWKTSKETGTASRVSGHYRRQAAGSSFCRQRATDWGDSARVALPCVEMLSDSFIATLNNGATERAFFGVLLTGNFLANPNFPLGGPWISDTLGNWYVDPEAEVTVKVYAILEQARP